MSAWCCTLRASCCITRQTAPASWQPGTSNNPTTHLVLPSLRSLVGKTPRALLSKAPSWLVYPSPAHQPALMLRAAPTPMQDSRFRSTAASRVVTNHPPVPYRNNYRVHLSEADSSLHTLGRALRSPPSRPSPSSTRAVLARIGRERDGPAPKGSIACRARVPTRPSSGWAIFIVSGFRFTHIYTRVSVCITGSIL